MRSWITVVLLLATFTNISWAQAPNEEGLKFFEQKIRPVLVQHCYSCHSVGARDARKLQGALFLDSAEGTLIGGESGPALIKGNVAESRMIKAMKYDGMEMPPTGKLSEEIIADFAKWIEMGAPDPRVGTSPIKPKREINIDEGRKWWSFQPLKIIIPPTIPDEIRAQSPIDHFIISAQQQQRLKSGIPTTKEKLIRRAYFDLIGLPPTPEQIDHFVNDSSPQAFEKVVDGLLESPRYGEKWARHWLDVARFAESGGYEFDGFRPGAYHYRDWVIRSLNNDLSYDQFVRRQLSGDKLRPDDYHGASATGFLVAGPYPGQITAKTVEGIRYDQLDDMLMTVGGSMLGLTLGCVRCHDHKYDPLQQKDYYSLAASLAQTVHGSRFVDPDPATTQQVWESYEKSREPLLAALRKYSVEEFPQRFAAWQSAELPKQPDTPRWQVMEPVKLDADRSWLKWLPGGIIAHDGVLTPGTVLFRRGQRYVVPNEERYSISLNTFQKNIASLRLDCFTEKSLPAKGPGLNGDGSFQLVELKVTARPLDGNLAASPQELKLKPVYAAFEDKDQPLGHAVDGKPETAWVVRPPANKDNAAVFEFEVPVAGFSSGTELQIELKFRDLGLGRIRVSLSTEPNPTTWAGDVVSQHLGEIRAVVAANGNKLPETLREPMTRWFSPFDTETAKVFQTIRDHVAAAPRPPLTEVYTTVAGGQDVYLLRRGEVDNKQGKVEAGFIQVLYREGQPPTSVSTQPVQSPADPRIRMADWITDVERGAGPLLARVMVNRLWQHHFGEGIVGTPNDFGAQGDRPSHPELLEWLATQFVANGWKLKPLHKLIMLSSTYQQSHEIHAENLQIDPANRYLWHFQPRRLDAELIRDELLAIGGNLDLGMYGHSILDNTPRRSIYLRVKRSELIPMMTMFDAPEPTQSVGERISTTVPTQSLAMMNSPFVRQQAEKLAQRIRPTKDVSIATSVELAYRIAFAHPPSESERNHMLAFIDTQRSVAGTDPVTNIEPALVEFCHVILCLNEFVYID